jgi:hypothetical protein
MPKRVLIDENLPQELRLLLGHHEAITTPYQDCSSGAPVRQDCFPLTLQRYFPATEQ